MSAPSKPLTSRRGLLRWKGATVMNPSNRKRFRARLTVLEAKESEHLLQRLKREEYEKHTNRIDLLRSKPEFELTPGELLALVLRQDPMYPAMKAWGRALRESQLQERKEYPHLHRSRVPKPCPACRTMSEQPP